MENTVATYLKVYELAGHPKVRLGEKRDGGYVIGNIPGGYDCYLSCGVSNEESFTRDFLIMYKMNEFNSYAFDGTIGAYPYHYTTDIAFIRKNIGPDNNFAYTNLHELIDKYDNIFLKMDIEGGEYPWLMSVQPFQLKKFKQIVIEFHGINDNSWNASYQTKLECLKKLAGTHYVVHAHGNNHAGITNGIPDVIELTYINKDLFTAEPKPNQTLMPIALLDYPNNIVKPDYRLNSYPFVSPPENNNVASQ
jgi:hypothetical protein